MRLIIATQNQGKLREIKKILEGLSISIISLAQLNRKFRIKEDGETFLENALKKTLPVSRAYPNDYVVGEDSGLEVEYLNLRPGIFSKRYSGKGATDSKNNRKILQELEGVKGKKRAANFRCCLVLVKNSQLIRVFEGKLKGIINEEIKGENGFGYDPIFFLPRRKKTTAQLSLDEKNQISHRAKAFRKLKRYLGSM